jgi:hypothetical protein
MLLIQHLLNFSQFYQGDNPAAAAAASFASGYRAIEAAQQQNLHALQQRAGQLSLDTAQLQVRGCVEHGALGCIVTQHCYIVT